MEQRQVFVVIHDYNQHLSLTGRAAQSALVFIVGIKTQSISPLLEQDVSSTEYAAIKSY